MDKYFTLIQLIIFCILLYSLWLLGIKKYLLASYRQDIFELRDKLFDFALDNNIEFNSMAYVQLRIYLNAFIRHAHRLTIYDLVTMIFFFKNVKLMAQNESIRISNIINQVNNKNSLDFLNKLYQQSLDKSVKYFIKSNPLVWLIIPFIILKFFRMPKDESKSRGNIAVRDSLWIVEQKLDPFWQLPSVENRAKKTRLIEHEAFT